MQPNCIDIRWFRIVIEHPIGCSIPSLEKENWKSLTFPKKKKEEEEEEGRRKKRWKSESESVHAG